MTERFIALAISRVSMVPEAPTSVPAMIRTVFERTKPVGGGGEAGEGVQQRDHDRHVGAADREHDQHAEEEREADEQPEHPLLVARRR